jgi:predicted AAA+ superfamily ATPase
MQRSRIAKLLEWKEKDTRKPLLIDGARQTGKTYLLQNLLGELFDNFLRVDFLESPEMAEAFAESLTPEDII